MLKLPYYMVIFHHFYIFVKDKFLEINLLSNLQSTLDRAAPDEQGQIQVTNQRPACLIVQKMTPIFTQLLERTGPDTDILQAICHFFDKSVRTMVEHGLEVITPMSGLICQIIAQSPIGVSSAIDLAQQIISLYWREKTVRLIFKIAFELIPCLLE